MRKKRAKEIALMEWKGIQDIIQKSDFILSHSQNIEILKQVVLDRMKEEHSVTAGERKALDYSSDCALCCSCADCRGCPLSQGEAEKCVTADHPYNRLYYMGDGRSTIDDCREAVKEIISMIETWKV